jgi:PEP-CTERM motif
MLAAMALTSSVHAQGSFQNLDFESAQIILVASDLVATTNALPGWTVFVGTNQQTDVFYNFMSSETVNLVGSNSMVLDGNFSVQFDPENNVPISISQTGLVPAGTESLLFEAKLFGSATMSVYLGGQDLSYVAMTTTANYTVYGADISAFANQTETLTFSALTPFAATGLDDWTIDDIQFSPSIVPEPSSSLLLLLGSGVFIYARRAFHR